MTSELQQFIENNIALIDQNTKEAWEEVYKINYGKLIGEFTETILNADINDPAEILGYIPGSYLNSSSIYAYEIPEKVTYIGYMAFENCNNLRTITIPSNVTEIVSDAFSGCKNLESVVFIDGVSDFGYHMFYNCEKLQHLEIPQTVVPALLELDGSAFYNCVNLKEIIFKGTKEQAIQSGIGNKSERGWRRGSSIKKIICLDGIIRL